MPSLLRPTALVLGGGLLLVAAPTPAAALGTLAGTGSAADPSAPLVAAVALIAEALLGWLLVVAAGSVAAQLPGLVGRTADAVVRRLAPSTVRRVVELALGLTVAVCTVGVVPAAASDAVPPAPPAPVSLDWPTAASAQPTAVIPTSVPAPPAVVTVRAGDSLWSVAADHLPAGASNARIAQAWPRWWAANRNAVGADPDLIHPGLQLHSPAQS